MKRSLTTEPPYPCLGKQIRVSTACPKLGKALRWETYSVPRGRIRTNKEKCGGVRGAGNPGGGCDSGLEDIADLGWLASQEGLRRQLKPQMEVGQCTEGSSSASNVHL